MKKATVAVLLLLTLAGCARVQHALVMTPQRAKDAFGDPVRRVHFVTQVGRVSTAASIGIACVALLSPTIVGMLVCPAVAVALDYTIYEYVLEPLSKERVTEGKPSFVAPYWEGGARTDEGERLINP